MPVVESLRFKDWSDKERKVEFLSSTVDASLNGFEVTVVTGRNGSNKSTLLRELVAALTIPARASSVQLRTQTNTPIHVICASGSVADRFPSKETPGGRNSEFDVPNYSYLGQRVGANLLSKKRPLETLLTFALDEKKAHRFEWDFFESAHRFAGIVPHVEYEIAAKRRNQKEQKLDILGSVQAMAAKEPNSESSTDVRTLRERPLPHLSVAMARWLLEEFHYDEFNALQQLLTGKNKRIRLLVGEGGATCDVVSNTALRLGFLTDLLSLSDAKVRPRVASSDFSAFELSSGEYHMYTTILGLGFGMAESSIVLLDEPENSLHPQWQQDFMDSVFAMCAQLLKDGHLVVCTHSPLIVSAAVEGSTIVDLTNDAPTVETTAFGASSDELLLSQFGIGSSRNRLIVDTVQRAVSLVERGDFENDEFLAMTQELTAIRKALRRDDPLVDVIDALIERDSNQ